MSDIGFVCVSALFCFFQELELFRCPKDLKQKEILLTANSL